FKIYRSGKYANNRKPNIILDKPLIPNNFSPWFITGFADAEASFIVKNFHKSSPEGPGRPRNVGGRGGNISKTGVHAVFSIGINFIDTILRIGIKKIFSLREYFIHRQNRCYLFYS